MRKVLSLSLLMITLALGACSGNQESSSTSGGNASNSTGSNSGNGTFLIDRLGDLLVTSPSTYATIGNGRSYEQMLKAMDNGESVLFSFSSFSCNHCHQFEPAYIQYMRANKPNIYSYYWADDSAASRGEYSELTSGIASYFGIENNNQNPFYYTPTVWLANKNGYQKVSEGSVTQEYLENSIKTLSDYTNVYYFSSFENYLLADSSDILTVLYSQTLDTENLYYQSIYPLAQKSSKMTYVLDYDSMSEEEKASALASFGLTEYIFSFSLNEKRIKEEDALSYYGASSNGSSVI